MKRYYDDKLLVNPVKSAISFMPDAIYELTTEIDANIKSMWYRFSRREDDYCIECSEDGVTFKQMRVCHMWKGDGTIRFGIYACSPYLEGYVIEESKEIQGYAMIAKSFSTEFGKQCIWIEDLYIKDKYRGLGLGNMLIEFITKKFIDCIFRLEVEEENERAIKLYKKCGFEVLPYMEMKNRG